MKPEVALSPLGHRVLLTHFLLYGTAAVCGDEGLTGVRVGWSGGLAPQPVMAGVDADALGELVHAHAVRCADGGSWLQRGLPMDPVRGLFSPRIAALKTAGSWCELQHARHAALDDLLRAGRRLDLRLLAALGEPAFWRFDRSGKPLQDDGANRLEMQPRNQGSEFVGTRLRALAAVVASRTADAVRDGLLGASVIDEVGKGRAASRTATGLRQPAPTDSAVAWCALWGIAQAPVALQVHERALTATHLRWRKDDGLPREQRAGHFVVPIWRGWWTSARLRHVLSSAALIERGRAATLRGSGSADDPSTAQHEGWLLGRGVGSLVVMPVGTFGSTSAPERRALGGVDVRLVAS